RLCQQRIHIRPAGAGLAAAAADLARLRRQLHHRRPVDLPPRPGGREHRDRRTWHMSYADWVAITGFVGMFVLMGLRVPIGIAMGIVGVLGFGAIRGMAPAFNLLTTSPVRTVTDFNLSLVPFFV